MRWRPVVRWGVLPLVIALATVTTCWHPVAVAESRAAAEGHRERLVSLNPAEILTRLDLSRPGLEKAKSAEQRGDRLGALQALLEHYRQRFPLPPKAAPMARGDLTRADQVVNHVFQWGPYEPADYGKDVNWELDPRGDIEWVAAVYRFYWAPPLAEAYAATREEKYARAFVELASDWIAKHPLEKRDRAHPVYKSWRGFAWLDIQTGVRAQSICRVFPVLVHAQAWTPEFLGVLLASLYDHQRKTELLPMGQVHNKAVFEQRGFMEVAATFPEFRDARRWLELALNRTRETFLAQVTPDGVQREWSFGYNMGVLRDAVEILRRCQSAGITVPGDYQERVRKMYDYVFAIATPELAGPMFGDASRTAFPSKDRAQWSLYSTLLDATRLLGDPKYEALAKLDRDRLPRQTSHAFPDAGMYVMRNEWGPDQIYFALHCSRPAISGHDQPDNGTFELCAYGRWLMPDTGFYTYGHDAAGRAWHRRTSAHQTLTLDGRDSRVDATHRLWASTPELDAAAVENRSYPGLLHRRTVWFVAKQFFVLLDEAIGDARGTLDLHFQLAPGPTRIDAEARSATTAFPDANVLVGTDRQSPVAMEEEEGWFACRYGHREPRTAFRYRHQRGAPAAFLTVIHPYRGSEPPEVSASLPQDFKVGASRVELRVAAATKPAAAGAARVPPRRNAWRIGRDFNQGTAWCRAEEPR